MTDDSLRIGLKMNDEQLQALRIFNWSIKATIAAFVVVALVVSATWNYFTEPRPDDFWSFAREYVVSFKPTSMVATPTILMLLFGCIVVWSATDELRGARRWLVRLAGLTLFGLIGYGFGQLFLGFFLFLRSLGVPSWLINFR